MAKEKILIQIENEIIELKNEELENFLADRKLRQDAWIAEQEAKQNAKETRIAAYKKLGLTNEEIAAII